MQLTDHPLAVFAASLCLLSIGAWMGAHLAKRRAPLQALCPLATVTECDNEIAHGAAAGPLLDASRG